MNRARKGAQGERDVRTVLEREGWYVTRSAASKGKADLVASNCTAFLYIQVKTGKRVSVIKAAKELCSIPAPSGTLFQVWLKRPRTQEWLVYDAQGFSLSRIVKFNSERKKENTL